ncbi:MAG: hypothetical protein MJ071_04005 [Oscillospiraceae bacterium]|nr:hypothetical protein [Oscillospiraceae bacterium]
MLFQGSFNHKMSPLAIVLILAIVLLSGGFTIITWDGFSLVLAAILLLFCALPIGAIVAVHLLNESHAAQNKLELYADHIDLKMIQSLNGAVIREQIPLADVSSVDQISANEICIVTSGRRFKVRNLQNAADFTDAAIHQLNQYRSAMMQQQGMQMPMNQTTMNNNQQMMMQ